MERLMIVRTDRHFHPYTKLLSFPIECILGVSPDSIEIKKQNNQTKVRVNTKTIKNIIKKMKGGKKQ